MQKSQACNKSQAEFELRETVEEFEKDIMALWNHQCLKQSPGRSCLKKRTLTLSKKILRGAREDSTKARRNIYDAIFTELAVVGGLVVRGLRVVVPKTPRDKVIKLAHEGHQGITKTKE